MELYLAVFFGCCIYILLQLNAAYMLPAFEWKTFFKTNWIPTLLNLVIGAVMVYAKDDITTIYPITFVSALMLGVAGQALLKKLTTAFDGRVNTMVGL